MRGRADNHDGLPHLAEKCTPQKFQEERYALLTEAVGKLKAAAHQGLSGRRQPALDQGPGPDGRSPQAGRDRPGRRLRAEGAACSRDLMRFACGRGRQLAEFTDKEGGGRARAGSGPFGDLVEVTSAHADLAEGVGHVPGIPQFSAGRRRDGGEGEGKGRGGAGASNPWTVPPGFRAATVAWRRHRPHPPSSRRAIPVITEPGHLEGVDCGATPPSGRPDP